MFEVMVCIPGGRPEDIYAEHKLAWSLLAGSVKPGDKFLYRAETKRAGSVYRFRSRSQLWGAKPSRLPRTGVMHVSLVCERRFGKRQLPIHDDGDAQCWVAEKLSEVGFDVANLQVGPQSIRRGKKDSMRIWLPVREITAEYEVADYGKAFSAFIDGVGRNPGFGFGMIVAEQKGRSTITLRC